MFVITPRSELPDEPDQPASGLSAADVRNALSDLGIHEDSVHESASGGEGFYVTGQGWDFNLLSRDASLGVRRSPSSDALRALVSWFRGLVPAATALIIFDASTGDWIGLDHSGAHEQFLLDHYGTY